MMYFIKKVYYIVGSTGESNDTSKTKIGQAVMATGGHIEAYITSKYVNSDDG